MNSERSHSRRILQYLYIHPLIRYTPNIHTTQTRHKINPISIISAGAQLSNLIDIEIELATYL